jgi:hypothetical protein
MRSFVTILSVLLLFTVSGLLAQGHVDPPFLQIQSAETEITIDGKLDETDWQRRFDHLVFRSNFKPGDIEYAVTGAVEVQAPYQDTTTTIVRMLHHGFDLYISLQSNDHSVCKFDGSWEGDGLFMKIADANGMQVEYKLFFNQGGVDPAVNYEGPGMYPGSGQGAALKHAATIVNDNTAPDSGYTAELVIHLDQLGYTNPYVDVPVLFNIMDSDGYTGAEGWEGGTFYKMWWGSEWGPETRTLKLADPISRLAYTTDEAFALDGQLNESFWNTAESVEIFKGSNLSTAGYYMQWGDTLNAYTDPSKAVVKFAHKGTDLYIGVQSNDASVCKWSPGWEADGLFLWMTYKDVIPGPGERMEIKAMYFDATEGAGISFETNANVPSGAAEGASFQPVGTVTHTETNGPDNGYSLEVVVHTDMFGYMDGDAVNLSAVIWDMDYSSADAYLASTADYVPHWWGAQWVDPNFEKYYMYRSVILSSETGPGLPQIAVKPASIDFGEIETSTLKDATFTVSNAGDADLVVTAVGVDNSVFSVNKTSFVVAAGGSVDAKVSFKPTTAGAFTGTVTIKSNAGDVAVSLTGSAKEGTEPPKPGHTDPAFLQIQSAERPIVIDGKLDETDWARRFDHLIFRSAFKPGDVEYGVTGEVTVQGPYADTTTTIVRVLHHGLDLYISLQSDDHSVCKFNGSWEGDGLFMKIADASGAMVEYKLYFNYDGANPDIHFEYPAIYAGSGQGAAWKHASTLVNDNTAADSGFTAEMVIHLDQLGYTDPYVDIPVLFNIFDSDGYVGGDGWDAGAFQKMWWGSEWGPVTRTLKLADPPTKVAVKTDNAITLDGQLTEAFWADADKVIVANNSNLSTAGYYMQWGDPTNQYTDQSQAIVKFAHKGTDLYIGVESDDASVCKWSPGWEADGLFLWMTYYGLIPGGGERMEIKNMFFDATEGAKAVFETNANVPAGAAEGASFVPEGTKTHTESNGPDAGYSLEVVVHTDMFGYADGDTVKLSTVIWDMDYASADAYNAGISDYHPLWWGAQWVDPNFEKHFMYRGVILSDQYTVGVSSERAPELVKNYRLDQNYPNPFNPTTSIEFQVGRATSVKIEVFNILGERVAKLVDGKHAAGIHSIEWDARDASGKLVGNGVYFYKITTPEFSQTRKMLLVK